MSLPEELFAQIKAWLSDLPGFSEQRQTFELLVARRTGTNFRVAIAGAISRGKTRLLNSLLDTSIFPEGSIPTTTVLTEVAYGKQPEAAFECRAGKTMLAPDSASLERFGAEGIDADKEGILRVKWPAPFLEHGLILYDTPGIDGSSPQRANLAFSALEDTEGAIVVVSASVPVSLPEKNFIRACLENRAIPHIAVAISFLDTIGQENLDHQIRFIQNRIKRINSGIEVWLTDAGFPFAGTRGASAIRDRLLAWANDPARQELRDQRDLQFCAGLLTACIGKLEERLNALKADQEDKRCKYRKASDDLDQQKKVWLELREDFLARSQDTVKSATLALENLRHELRKTMSSLSGDDFPRELRQQLAASARSLSDLLRSRLDKDTTALRQAIGQNFGYADLPGLESARAFAIGYALPEMPDKKAGDIMAMLINYARGVWKNMGPMLPLPPILRGGAQELVDRGLQSLSDILGSSFGHNRQLEQYIEDFFNGLRKQLGDSIIALYTEKAEHLREEQDRWIALQQEVLAALRVPGQAEARFSATNKEIARGKKLLAAVQANRRSPETGSLAAMF